MNELIVSQYTDMGALSTYRNRRGRGRSLRWDAFLSGRPLPLLLLLLRLLQRRVTWRRLGAALAFCDDGFQLLQLLIFHPEFVLHLELHGVNASILHGESGR